MNADEAVPADDPVVRFRGHHSHSTNAGVGTFPNPGALRQHLVIAHDDSGAAFATWDALPFRHASYHEARP